MQQIKEYLNFLELPQFNIFFFLEVLTIAYLLYQIITHTKDSRFWVLTKGVVILAFSYLIIYVLDMTILKILLEGFFVIALFALLMAFQPELRNLLEGIGNKKIYLPLSKEEEELKYYSDETIKEIAEACFEMSKVKTGALIVIEKDLPLSIIKETGIKLDAAISSQLLINIFKKNTPLHDGAIVISNDRISHGTCILPLTQKKINKKYGTRHRAGLGATEEYNCLTVIVSEETGKITLIEEDGSFKTDLSKERLESLLKAKQIYGTKNKNIISKDNFAQRINHNRDLKLISTFLAFLIWIVIFNTTNPITSKTFNVPVSVINGDILIEQNAFFEVPENFNISIKVKAKSSTLNNISKEDILITADAEKISITNAVPLAVSINGLKPSDYEYSLSEQSIVLKLENITAIDMPISYELINIERNTHVSNIEADYNSISITAPASVTKNINSVVATIDVHNQTENFQTSAKLKVYDNNGDDITDSVLSMSSTIINVKCTVYKTKDIPIVLNVELNQDNYTTTDITLSNDYVTVAGLEEDLNNLSEYKINEELEIKENVFSYIKQLDIKLDDKYIIVQNDKVNASINIAKQSIEEYYIPSSIIEIKQIPENLNIAINKKAIPINLNLIETNIESTDEFNLKEYKFFIDASPLLDTSTKAVLRLENNEDFMQEIEVAVSTITKE